MNEMMNMKMSAKMNKGIESLKILKNLKNLMQIFAESANSAKQIFATFATFAMSIFSVIANIANIAMQIFKRPSVATLRTVPVKSTVKVALKSRITSSLPAFAMVAMLILSGWNSEAWGKDSSCKGIVHVALGKGTVQAEVWTYNLLSSDTHNNTSPTTNSMTAAETETLTNGNTKYCKFRVVDVEKGYNFDAWYTDSKCTEGKLTNEKNEKYAKKGNNSVFEYYAKFVANFYDVTLDANGGSGSSQAIYPQFDSSMPSTLKAGGAIVAPTKTGYIFAGYYASDGITKYYNADLSSARTWDFDSKQTLSAHWTPITYTITLDNEGGSPSTSSVDLTYDSNSHAAIANPTKDDYTFGGWWTADNGAGSLVIDVDGTMQENVEGYTGAGGIWTRTTSTTLYAKWIANSKTIYLNNQSATTPGTERISVLYNKNDNLTDEPAITIPAKTGYTFCGYYTNENGVGDQIIAANGNVNASVTGYTDEDKNWQKETDVILYAYWKRNQTITWDQTLNTSVRSTVITLDEAEASSELDVTYTATSNAGTVRFDVVEGVVKMTCLTAGSVTVTAHQAGNSSWNAAPDVSKTFTIIEHSVTKWPTASTITYKQSLASSILSDEGSATVAGSFAWENESVQPNAGTPSYVVVFTPDNSSGAFGESDKIRNNVSVTVNKATPDVTCSIADNYMVDADALDLQSLWTREGDGAITYSIVEDSFIPSGENNEDATEPAIAENRYLSLGQAGSLRIQMSIAAGTNYSARTVTKDITIHKYNSVFSGNANLEVLVDEDVASEYVLTYTKPNDAYVGAANHVAGAPALEGSFHYALGHDVQTENVAGSPDGSVVIAYNPSTKVATGKNQGVGTVTLTQDETYKYKSVTTSFNVTVAKHEPEFTWNLPANYYYNTTLTPFVTKTSGGEYTVTSDNEQVASTSGDNVTIYNKPGTANIRVLHPETYYWNEYDHSESITPEWKSNKVTLTVTESNYASVIENHYAGGSDRYQWNDNGVTLGGKNAGEAEGYDSRYIDIHFTGIPDSISFTFGSTGLATREDWWVKEKTEDGEWGNETIWTSSSDNGTCKVPLKQDTRWVRLRGYCNYGIYFRNIQITKKEYFKTNKTSLNFESNLKDSSPEAQTFKFYHASAGYITSVTSNDAHFTVTPSSVATGGEVCDSAVITVNYLTTEVGSHSGRITITDNIGNSTYVTVTGTTVTKHTPTITWPGTKEFEVGDVIANGFVVKDENGDPIEGGTWSFVSKNEEVIKIVDGKIVAQELDEDTKTAKIVGTLTAGEYDNFVTGSSEDIILTVKRKENTITVSGASATMLMDATMSGISVSSTNSALGGYTITSAPSADKAVFDLEAGTIISKNYKETMNWTIHQDADGTYKAANLVFSVDVVSAPEDDSKKIYIYEQTPADTEVDPGTFGEKFWEIKNVAKTLWFQARGTSVSWYQTNPSMQPKQYQDASGWNNDDITPIKDALQNENPYATTHSRSLNIAATGVKFEKSGDGQAYLRNVKVECYGYLRSNVYNDDAGSVNITTQADGTTPVYVNKEGVGTITIYYGIANGGDLKLMCNNPKFTFGERHATELTLVEDKDLPKSGKVQLNVYYTSEAAGVDEARVVVYNQVYYHEITLSGTTVALEPAAVAVTVDEDEDWTEDIDATTPVEVTGTNITVDKEIEVYSLNISSGTTLTITPTGGLTVGAGGVTIGGEAKSAGKLVLQAITPESESESGERGQTAYIRFAPEYKAAMPEATIELYSVGYKDVLGGSGADYWQYVGVPVDVKDYAAKTAFPKSLVQSWHEDQGRWVNDRSTLKLQPFVGYATSQYRNEDGYKMVFEGQLAQNRDEVVIDLDYTEDATHNLKGWNLIANSFAAPIDITRLTVEDFGGADATIYLWNSRENNYVEIPVESLDKLPEEIQRVIPSMQAFFVHTNEKETTLTLNYNRLVWRGTQENMPLKVQKAVDVAVTGRMQITMIDAFGKDELYLLESNSYDKAYENGYDAPKKAVAGRSAIYAIEDRELAVDATDDMRGTKIGIRAGEVDSCQLVFTNVESDHALYFVDNMTGDMYYIEEGKTITLKYIDQDFEGRFEIVGSHNNHDVSTGVDGQKDEKITTKYIKDNTVYILKNGLKYNSLGQRVQ